MKETHFAYKIDRSASELVCTSFEFSEDSMLALLKEIQAAQAKGLYWIFKQFEGKSKEALCLIDCEYGRIYYHYSGDVEDIKLTIQKLSHSK